MILYAQLKRNPTSDQVRGTITWGKFPDLLTCPCQTRTELDLVAEPLHLSTRGLICKTMLYPTLLSECSQRSSKLDHSELRNESSHKTKADRLRFRFGQQGMFPRLLEWYSKCFLSQDPKRILDFEVHFDKLSIGQLLPSVINLPSRF